MTPFSWVKTLLLTLLVCPAFIASALAEGEKFVVISHAPDSEPWWDTIKNATKVAAKAMRVNVQYQNPPSGNIADMARIIDQAVARNPDGIITTIADFEALKGPISAATKKGIPVITINSGTSAESEALNAVLHIGQPEYEAGFGAGEKAKAAGVNRFICVNNFITNRASIERCQGFADALGIPLAGNMIDAGRTPKDTEKRVEAFLKANPDIEAILTLGIVSAHPTLKVLNKLGLEKLYFATFDVSPKIIQAIKDDVIDLAIDQQPYIQGYLSIVTLTLKVRYGVAPTSSISSGPEYISKQNVNMLEAYGSQYR